MTSVNNRNFFVVDSKSKGVSNIYENPAFFGHVKCSFRTTNNFVTILPDGSWQKVKDVPGIFSYCPKTAAQTLQYYNKVRQRNLIK